MSWFSRRKPPEWAQPLDATQFARFHKALRQALVFAKQDVPIRDDGTIEAQVGELTSVISLHNLVRGCAESPADTWDDRIEAFVEAALTPPPMDVPPLADALPMLRVSVYEATSVGDKLPDGVYRELTVMPEGAERGALVAVLTIDLPRMVAWIAPRHVEQWGTPVETLWERAIANVAALPIESVHNENDDTPPASQTVWGADHFHSPANLLRLAALAPDPPAHGLLIAVPTRHMLVVVPLSCTDPEWIARTAVQLLGQAMGMVRAEGAISPLIYWTRGDLPVWPVFPMMGPPGSRGVSFPPGLAELMGPAPERPTDAPKD